MIDPETSTIRELVGWVMSGIFGVALGAMTLMQRYSKVGLNRARDGDEVDSMRVKNARIAKLETDLDIAYDQRNSAVSELGALTATVKYLGEQLAELRREQTKRAGEVLTALNDRSNIADIARDQMAKDIQENTGLTAKAVERADAAYKEANTINQKIADIGLMAKDGSKTAPDEPEGQ